MSRSHEKVKTYLNHQSSYALQIRQDDKFPWPFDHMVLQNCYISTTTMPLTTKLGRVITDLHNLSLNLTWTQTLSVISILSLHSYVVLVLLLFCCCCCWRWWWCSSLWLSTFLTWLYFNFYKWRKYHSLQIQLLNEMVSQSWRSALSKQLVITSLRLACLYFTIHQ